MHYLVYSVISLRNKQLSTKWKMSSSGYDVISNKMLKYIQKINEKTINSDNKSNARFSNIS